MSDSTHPLYEKGYRRGRRRTEQEVERLARQQSHADRWNAAFLALLPTAMVAENWTLSKEQVRSGDQRVALAAAWADLAVRRMK